MQRLIGRGDRIDRLAAAIKCARSHAFEVLENLTVYLKQSHQNDTHRSVALITARGFTIALSSLAFTAFSTGCSTASKETHYYRAVSEDGTVKNYYKLDISSSSELASSRFVSGYFDEQAVNQYFSEVTGGKQTLPGTTGTNSQAQGKPATITDTAISPKDVDSKAARIEPAGPGRNGTKLVLLLSSNSDAIANEIGAIADGQQISNLVGQILTREKQAELDAASLQLNKQYDRAGEIIELGAVTLRPENLKSSTQQERELSKAAILNMVNKIALSLGAPEPFDDLEAAKRWLSVNRARLERE